MKVMQLLVQPGKRLWPQSVYPVFLPIYQVSAQGKNHPPPAPLPQHNSRPL